LADTALPSVGIRLVQADLLRYRSRRLPRRKQLRFPFVVRR
jgi:hypothetical protein